MRLNPFRRDAEPTRVGDAVFVGSVWTNGDPILVADAEDAARWRGSERYDDLLERIHNRRKLSIAVGDGRAFVLELEFDDSTVDVFRHADGRLLVLGIVFADGDHWNVLVGAALEDDGEEEIGAIEVRSGRLALLAAAGDWAELTQVDAEPRAAPKQREAQNDALLVSLSSGRYSIGYRYVERDQYGLQAWVVRRI